MEKINFGPTTTKVAPIIVGCMRLNVLTPAEMNHLIHTALDLGIDFFDHADIYAQGQSEALFGQAWKNDASLKREEMFIQTKCGIKPGVMYDLSKEHIISSVEASLKRLQVDYLDSLLLHRPDALVDPSEVAAAFDELHASGKVRYFGVSNHKPMQIELLKKYVTQPLVANQLQFSLPVANMVANGMEVNMTSEHAVDYDGSVLDYSRLHEMTIQAWSPFQMPNWQGVFIDAPAYQKLNDVLQEIADNYGVSKTTIATAWILRHPAKMQVIAGTTKAARLQEIAQATKLTLTKEEWYRLYLAAGYQLP